LSLTVVGLFYKMSVTPARYIQMRRDSPQSVAAASVQLAATRNFLFKITYPEDFLNTFRRSVCILIFVLKISHISSFHMVCLLWLIPSAALFSADNFNLCHTYSFCCL